MNHPLYHRGYTFYQSSYIRVRDPHTGSPPGSSSRSSRSPPIPAGPSFTPVACWWSLGAFIQFYMRAGIFTDGGKKERERAARRRQAKGKDADKPPAGAGRAL